MGRFASTVPYYEQARQPYGAAFFAAVARELHLDGARRLIDIGAGPGLLAIGFAPFCSEVCAVDPEPAMISAARLAAQRAGVALRLVEARVEALPEDIGQFDLVTIGRALHWMEPAATRGALDRLAPEDGMVLICRAFNAAARNPWLRDYDAVRNRWSEALDPDRSHIDLDAFFGATRFRRSAVVAVETEGSISIERLVERALSMSTSSPERLGGDEPRFRAALRDALTPFAVDGAIRECVCAEAKVFTAAPSPR